MPPKLKKNGEPRKKPTISDEDRKRRSEAMKANRRDYRGNKKEEEYVVEEEELPEETEAEEDILELEVDQEPEMEYEEPPAPKAAYKSKPQQQQKRHVGGSNEQLAYMDRKFNELFSRLQPVSVNVHTNQPSQPKEDKEEKKLIEKTLFKW